jgi:hypothetical protein
MELPHIPKDISLHDRKGAMKAMRLLRRTYMPNIIVQDGTVEPGDIVVVGPWTGGPGHALIGGSESNTLWHVNSHMVDRSGLDTGLRIFRIYRALDKHLWEHSQSKPS